MAVRDIPPMYTGDMALWARELEQFLTNALVQEEGLVPKSILLAHQLAGITYKATESGMLMYQKATGLVAYSRGGTWHTLSGGEWANLDGGVPNSNYGGITPIDGGVP